MAEGESNGKGQLPSWLTKNITLVALGALLGGGGTGTASALLTSSQPAESVSVGDFDDLKEEVKGNRYILCILAKKHEIDPLPRECVESRIE